VSGKRLKGVTKREKEESFLILAYHSFEKRFWRALEKRD
jgi:hypothetical protein